MMSRFFSRRRVFIALSSLLLCSVVAIVYNSLFSREEVRDRSTSNTPVAQPLSNQSGDTDSQVIQKAFPVGSNIPTIHIPVYNPGPSSLRVVSVKVSCDCVVPVEPYPEIKPGQSANIALEMEPQKEPGNRKVDVLIRTDSEEHALTIKILEVTIEPAFKGVPDEVNLGSFSAGSSFDHKLILTPLDAEEINYVSESKFGHVSARLNRSNNVGDFALSILGAVSDDPGVKRDLILIRRADQADLTLCTIPVRYTSHGIKDFSQSKLFFGRLSKEQATSRSATFTFTGSRQAISVIPLSDPPAGLSIRKEYRPKLERRVILHFDWIDLTDSNHGSVDHTVDFQIKFDNGDEMIRSLKLVGLIDE